MSENRIPVEGFSMLSIGPHPTVALVDGWTRYPYRISRCNPEDPKSPRVISLPNYLTTTQVAVVRDRGTEAGIAIFHGKELVGVVYTDKYGNQSIKPEGKVKFLLGEPLGNGVPLQL